MTKTQTSSQITAKHNNPSSVTMPNEGLRDATQQTVTVVDRLDGARTYLERLINEGESGAKNTSGYAHRAMNGLQSELRAAYPRDIGNDFKVVDAGRVPSLIKNACGILNDLKNWVRECPDTTFGRHQINQMKEAKELVGQQIKQMRGN